MTDPVKYDDVDWHVEGAISAGQPEENAAIHIGLYLGWLIQHDLYNPDFFAPEWIEAVKRGEMTGSEALDAVDQKLVSDVMTGDGAAFTDWYYGRYLSDYAEAFADLPDYGIAGDAASHARIGPVLDLRFAEWRNGGRPAGSARPSDELPAELAGVPETYAVTFPPRDGWDDLNPESREFLELEAARALEQGWTILEPPPPPHESPDLEAMIPIGMMKRPMVSSVAATQWRNAALNRSLKRLGVDPRNALVANGIGSVSGPPGSGALTVTLYSVPGTSATRLDGEFRMVLKKPRGFPGREEDKEIVGRAVHWEIGPGWVGAWWALDALVVATSAPDDTHLEQLIQRLP